MKKAAAAVLILALAVLALALHRKPDVRATRSPGVRFAEFEEPSGPATTEAFVRPKPDILRTGVEEEPEEESVSLPESQILADLLADPAKPAEAMRRAPEWIGSPLAADIAATLLGSGPEARAFVAELVLSGRLDLPLPELQAEYVAAAQSRDPERQLRAVSRLAPESAIAVVRGPHRADVRYEALRVLDRAGRGTVVAPEEREAIVREFEAFVGETNY